jgi:hypothetical protein
MMQGVGGVGELKLLRSNPKVVTSPITLKTLFAIKII